ncbi:MAG TPA: RNB domain-containing ribonuclease [Pirellulales bacterium]|nr:RNB domain-containing ribonuclease [Pirellulales bacterium]
MNAAADGFRRLREIARRAMLERGLAPDFPEAALRQLHSIQSPAHRCDGELDLRDLPWCSIDNDDSRDLDQLTVAEELKGGETKVLVAIADVDSLVAAGTPIDQHAQLNTTSVYTAAQIFTMLPEKLSTDLTSLCEGQDRTAVVTEMVMAPDGSLVHGAIHRAIVRNKAKLAYHSVADWLDGKGAMPARVAAVSGMAEQLRLQWRVSQAMKELRHEHGALDLRTLEPRALVSDSQIVGLEQELTNCARELIEDFMIGANGVSARFLEQRRSPSLRRVVRSPQRWDRIVEVAAEHGETLPAEPSAVALSKFLRKQREADPLRFPDLSLTIVKLLGRGEYVAELPGQKPPGHFGLAVRDYTHSTAPNRRYPDLITQRLLKATISATAVPYGEDELEWLARHCTLQEDAANKVERRVRKSAAALFLAERLGESFDALVTGAAEKGTWVRVLEPPVEGKLVEGTEGLDVGHRLRVKLVSVDIDQGFIDFVRGERE